MAITTILFDLDNTLYPSSSGLMRAIDTRIVEYVRTLLGISMEEAMTVRQDYFLTYGTTLRGLQHHHNVDAEHYLNYVHELAMDSFVASDAELDHLLGQLNATKIIFTNSPREHAERVLKALAIEQHFSQIFDIRFFLFSPKPDPAGYQRALDILGVNGNETVLIEDTLKNLVPARTLGMTTILIGDPNSLEAAALSDYVVPDILAAIRIVLELEQA